jgi:hypothetical protein
MASGSVDGGEAKKASASELVDTKRHAVGAGRGRHARSQHRRAPAKRQEERHAGTPGIAGIPVCPTRNGIAEDDAEPLRAAALRHSPLSAIMPTASDGARLPVPVSSCNRRIVSYYVLTYRPASPP